MAAARSRIAIALAALGIAFAACFGGDHGAARAAVGHATGPLIGSSLAGAAILDGDRHGAGRRAHRRDRRDQHRRREPGPSPSAASGLIDTPLGRKLDLVVEDVTPGRTARRSTPAS